MTDEARFETLKKTLFDHGYEAISDFVGYDFDETEEKDITDNRLDEAYQQMPPEEFERFYCFYCHHAC